jgi:hypothetical protein
MALKKLLFKPGVNRENTRYTNEGGWYESDKIRFRQGTPEKIGGYQRLSPATFLGTCRKLWNWVSLGSVNYLGAGTNLKYYIESGGAYYDITPLRTFNSTGTLTNPFTTTNASKDVSVADTAHGLVVDDVVFFEGAVAVGGIPAADLNTRHVVKSVTDANNYVIEVATPATSSTTGGGAVDFQYYSYTRILNGPFDTNATTTVTVNHTGHGATAGDFVTFSNASTVDGLNLNQEFQITEVIDADTYTITTTTAATGSTTGGGGSAVEAQYQIPVGAAIQVPTEGWSVGAWGVGAWGIGSSAFVQLRIWNNHNFGEDLVYCPRGDTLYYWSVTDNTLAGRGVAVNTLLGANNVPTAVNSLIISDVSRFVLCFGTNELGSSTLDPMLIRWSDQESVVDWTPTATNQAGSIRLSAGSEIVTQLQSRQEILVWTDTALYALQYVGAPIVWGSTILADNISIMGPNATAVGAGVVYWMGNGKFYKYDGRVQTLRCDLRQFIFQDFNMLQNLQVFAGSLEEFNEIWWWYPSSESDVPDRYVVYNYVEDVWYYGSLTRYAWIDKSTRDYPVAAMASKLAYHEVGVDDETNDEPVAIEAYIESAEFDLEDGDKFGFIYRLLPDITFRGSTAASPTATFTMYPMVNAGSGYGQSIGGSETASVTRSVSVPVEQFTGQIYTRVRGRQMVLRVGSTGLGVTWQLGAPRMDIRPDGRR